MLALAAVYVAIRGYSFAGNVHQDQFLPFVWKLVDPSLYPSDPFPATGAYYPSWFLDMAAAGVRLGLSLSAVMAAAYAVMVLGLASGTAAVADALFESVPAKVLGSLLALCSESLNAQSFFGEDGIFRSYADPSGLAWVLLLWVLASWLQGKRTRAAVLLGLAANLTPLPVLHVGLILGIALLLSGSSGLRPKELLKQGALFLLAAGPMLLRIALMPRQPPADTALALETLKTWFPFHYFPESWPAGKWLMAASYTGLFAALLYKAPEALRRKLAPVFAGALAVVLCGFLARLSGSGLLVRLQFFRADTLLILAGTFLTAEAVVARFKAGSHHDLIAAGVLIATTTVWFCWPLGLAALAVLLVPKDRPLPRAAVWSAVFLAAAWSLDRGSRGEPVLIPPVTAFLLFIAAPLALLPERRPDAGVVKAAAAGILLAAFMPFLSMAAMRVQSGSLTNLSGESLQREQEWSGLLEWCEKNTASDGVFVINPDTGGFRALARRGVVFEWVDGSAIHWEPGYAGVWQERFKSFHGTKEALAEQWRAVSEGWHPVLWTPGARQHKDLKLTLGDLYDGFTDADFRTLLRKYPARYIITESDAPLLKFPILTHTEHFRIYSVLNFP